MSTRWPASFLEREIMKPNFTDSHKFAAGGYIPASKTDISKTFARVRREMAEREKTEVETMKNVKQMKVRK